jgi:hypothetical protein
VPTIQAVPTLILTRRFTPDSNALWNAAIAAGWDVERLQSMRPPPDLAAREPVFYGETLWADAVAETLGIDVLQPTTDGLPRLPERDLKRRVRLATLAEARAFDMPMFVKAPDEKWITARVYGSGKDIEAQDVEPLAPVLISEPVRFRLEFRTFVLERGVAALSPYIRDGDVARDDEGDWSAPPAQVAACRAFADELLADPEVALPPAVVIDVGQLDDGAWAVVEANACWASGICGCEPAAVLRVLRRASVPAGSVADADRTWVRSLG